MTEPIYVPTYAAWFHCPKCGKDYEEGVGTSAERLEKICWPCRWKMPHKIHHTKGTVQGSYVKRVVWPEDDWVVVVGDCPVCQQFPCEHTHDILNKQGLFGEPLELIRKKKRRRAR